MRNLLIAMFFSLAFVATAEGETKSAPPQTSFGVEEELKIPAKLPNDVLEILKQDERNQTCLEIKSANDMPAAWFKASEIDLNADRLQDLIVMAEDACLYGANIAPFWIFLQIPKGYKLVLNVYSLSLEVLKTKTNGHSDISATSATAVRVFSSVFRFNGERYETQKTAPKNLRSTTPR